MKQDKETSLSEKICENCRHSANMHCDGEYIHAGECNVEVGIEEFCSCKEFKLIEKETSLNSKYQKDNPEKAKARQSKRYYTKRTEILSKNKEYRRKNKDKIKQYHKKYRDDEKNREKINLRARHYQSGFRDEIIREAGECELCGSKKELELHHQEYKKDSKVNVLCSTCHKRIHRKIFGDKLTEWEGS